MSNFAIGVFEPLIDVWRWITSSIPRSFKLPKLQFNFIAWHYVFMITMTLVGSILLYPPGLMDYTDSLFFAAGMATQSGLNTLDINTLYLYQQVVMMLVTCVCTPIFINTVVVFIRLYWFEKRFEHIVKEQRARRKTKPRSISSRSKSQMKEENDEKPDLSALEHGVRGLSIVVDKSTARFLDRDGNAPDTAEKRRAFRQRLAPTVGEESTSANDTTPESSRSATLTTPEDPTVSQEPDLPQATFMGMNPKLSRDIQFADEVSKDGQQPPELAHVPENRDVSKHIEFIERQQANAKKEGALYIPGPRDFEKGLKPEELDRDQALQRLNTGKTSEGGRSDELGQDEVGDDDDVQVQQPSARRGITINVPDHPGRRDRAHVDEPTVEKDDEIENDVVNSPVSRLDRLRSGLSRRNSLRALDKEGQRSFAKTWTNLTSKKDEDPMPYLSWTATTGRNSMFVGLTAEQREELGGIEYRALKTLAKVLLCYYVGFHLLGMLVLLPWIVSTQPWKSRVQDVSQNPVWWGFFTPASMFNDLGFTLTPDSMLQFESAVLPLLFGSFLIIIGNTGFPCMLRFIIWAVSKMVPYGSDTWEELRFLLDHPRRCFTLLFPSKATWWLFWVLMLLNIVDLIFFIVLDLNDPTVTHLAPGLRVLNGWFQATSTRTAGFASVNLAELHAAIQVSYMVMMYISVFPIAISVRRTNVYEEKSLGIFGGEEDAGDDAEQSYVSTHLRRQLSFDLWFIFAGFFIIAIVEGDRIQNTNEYAFTAFSVLFEIVSAYGTVGLSLGYPNVNTSFSGQFRTISKLVIIAMMLRGRHRGLPYALDRAILLPSEKLQQNEAKDGEILSRRMTRRASLFAEENAHHLNRNATWSDGDIDQYGLPRQHTASQYAFRQDIAMTSGAGGDHELHSSPTRRSTAMSSKSMTGSTKAHQRSRSLSRVLAGGLSAGPTLSKKE